MYINWYYRRGESESDAKFKEVVTENFLELKRKPVISCSSTNPNYEN